MSTLRATGSRLQCACWLLLSLAALHSFGTVHAQPGCPTITPPSSGPANRTVNIAMMFWGPPLDDTRFSSNGTRKEVWTRNPMLDGWNGPSPMDILFLRAYLLWEERMELPAAYGGGPGLILLDGSIMRFNISWFNAGEFYTLVASQDEYADFYQHIWAHTLIQRLADPRGPYGRQHFIITPLQGHVPITILTSLACEETQSCMVVTPIGAEARMFICQDPMPIDCTNRGRRTGSRRFEYTVSPASNGDYWGSGSLSLAVNQGVRRVFIVAEPWAGAIITQLHATAAQLGLEVVGVQQVTMLGDDWSALNTSVAEVTHRIQAARVDMVLFISAFATPTLHQLLVWYWREIDYLPAAVVYVAGGSAFLPDDVRSYFMIETFWLPQLAGAAFHAVSSDTNFETFPANATHDSPAVFADAYRLRFHVEVPLSSFYQAARSFHTITIIQKLLEFAQTEDPEAIRYAVTRIATPGVFHAVQFDQWGRSLPFDNYVVQSMPDGSERILTPLGLGSPPVLPIPLWSERAYSSRFLSKTSDRIAFAFAVLSIFYLLGWLAWLVRNWHHALIRVRDPLFSALSLCGLMLLVASNFFATFHQTDVDCMLTPRLTMWGLTLGFAPLVLKNLRIWSMWHNRSTFAPAVIKEWHLGVALIALLAIDSAISLAWFVETGMSVKRVTPDPHRPSLDYYTCDHFAHGRAYLAVHIGWKAVCLGLAMWLAYLLRDVSSTFSESRFIALCVYNVTITLAILFPIISTDAAGNEGTLLVRNYLLIFLALATSSLSCVPKCIAVRASEAKRLEQEAVNKALNAMHTPEQDEDTLGSQDHSPPQQQREVQVHAALPALPEEHVQTHSMDDPVNRSWANPAALSAAVLQSIALPAVGFQSSIGGAVVAPHPVNPATSSLHPSPAMASDVMGATRPPPSVRIQPRAVELHLEMQCAPHVMRLTSIPQSGSPISVDDADARPFMLGDSRDLLDALTSEELHSLYSTLVHRAARQQHPGLSPAALTPLCSAAASSASSGSSSSSGSSTSDESSKPAAPSRQMLTPLTAVVVHMD